MRDPHHHPTPPAAQPHGGGGDNLHGTVLVLQDEEALVNDLRRLFQGRKLEVKTYSHFSQLLAAALPSGPCCLLACADGSQGCGLAAYEQLKKSGCYLPAVFFAKSSDFRLAVQAMRAGAEDFLPLPFEDTELIAAVVKALERSRQFSRNNEINLELRRSAALLTEREREIVRLVVAGMLNKEIADHLGLALVTVKVHRGNAMHKLGARTGAELARIARSVGILSPSIEPSSSSPQGGKPNEDRPIAM